MSTRGGGCCQRPERKWKKSPGNSKSGQKPTVTDRRLVLVAKSVTEEQRATGRLKFVGSSEETRQTGTSNRLVARYLQKTTTPSYRQHDHTSQLTQRFGRSNSLPGLPSVNYIDSMLCYGEANSWCSYRLVCVSIADKRQWTAPSRNVGIHLPHKKAVVEVVYYEDKV